MHTVHRTRIAAPLEEVFALARDVEAWPQLLREYRWCRVLERTPRRLVFAMGGRIRLWPARWTAVQEARPEDRRITFRHLSGITRGMEVEWRFAPDGNTVDVELVHDLTMRWPVIGRLVSDLIVGPIFIQFIARRTLEAVKARAEAALAGGPTAGRPAEGETP
ncbi:MAG: SRPBCC family protein [Armatimonadota bacterium]|nr:SRPBCC family protein [Armatimonadota bacterium]